LIVAVNPGGVAVGVGDGVGVGVGVGVGMGVGVALESLVDLRFIHGCDVGRSTRLMRADNSDSENMIAQRDDRTLIGKRISRIDRRIVADLLFRTRIEGIADVAAGRLDSIGAVSDHADVKFPLPDSPVRNVILARQMTEAADVVGTSQIELDFVWMGRLRADPLGVPECSWISVDGVRSRSGWAAWPVVLELLAVDECYRKVCLGNQTTAGHSESAFRPAIRGELPAKLPMPRHTAVARTSATRDVFLFKVLILAKSYKA